MGCIQKDNINTNLSLCLGLGYGLTENPYMGMYNIFNWEIREDMFLP